MNQGSDPTRITESTAQSDPVRPRLRLPQRQRTAAYDQEPPRQHGSGRETIESVVIAFILAFLFRTFEVEAFVIPTGSMAPTLLGRHKDMTCAQCAWEYTVGATDEIDHNRIIVRSVCPNCRFINPMGTDQPAYKGDRILVLKALFDLPEFMPEWLREPQRWDVIVFMFPEEPQVNYIKRLVGMPGEEVRIHYGNVFTRREGEENFTIARKSPDKQKVMRMIVYDNDHQSTGWRSRGWPARWQPEQPGAWRESENGRRFESNSSTGEWTRLNYRHLAQMWNGAENSQPPRAQLVTDFYAYNSALFGENTHHIDQEFSWVGDLNLTARVQITEARGAFRLELVEAGERYTCEFDLDEGTCELRRIGRDGVEPGELLASSRDAIRQPGSYSINFVNFDDRLTVAVDDRLLFGEGHDYDGAPLASAQVPTELDLRPAAISVRDASIRVSDLVLYRDIYYTHSPRGSHVSEYPGFSEGEAALSDPERWQPIGEARVSTFEPLGPDDFLMLGDNSPKSRDGRVWESGAYNWVDGMARERGETARVITDELSAMPGGDVATAPSHVVRRQLLIGRAFYVYWPHGVPFGPFQYNLNLGRLGVYRVPFYPNVAKMKLIE